jgi:hypothetical protein
MPYSNRPLQHLEDDGSIVTQVIAPPDFPGDMNPPANNVATSRYTTRCSSCLTEIPPGTPYQVSFCDGCGEASHLGNDLYLFYTHDHTFVIGTCCDTDFASELAGDYLAVDEPLPLGRDRYTPAE